jgi:hypothetical protein
MKAALRLDCFSYWSSVISHYMERCVRRLASYRLTPYALRFSLSLLLTAFGSLGFSQVPDTLWARTMGGANSDLGECIQLTADSCLIIAGHTQSFGAGASDFYLIKIDANGDTLWTRVYGTSGDEVCYHVLQTPDNGYLLTGLSGDSLCLMKTDTTGYVEWTKYYMDGYDCIGYRACVSSDNGYVITGHCHGSLGDVWLLKTDTLGDTLWTGAYGFGSGDDWGQDVLEVSDGYVIVGTSFYTGADVYLLKTDYDGVQLWEKWYGGNMHDAGYSIVPTFDNCYYVVGMYWATTTEADAWVLKINDSGDTLWTKTYGGYGTDYGLGIVPTETDSGFVITGETALPSAPADLYVLKCDAQGDSVWLRTYGGGLPDGAESMTKMYDGGFAICGYTRSFGAGSYDVWILRMSGEPGVQEENDEDMRQHMLGTIVTGPLSLFGDREYRIFDVIGRQIHTLNPAPGIYFIEVDGKISEKIVKIR